MLTLCGDVYVFQADCVSELTHVNPLLRPSAADLLHGSIFLSDDEVWFSNVYIYFQFLFYPGITDHGL